MRQIRFWLFCFADSIPRDSNYNFARHLQDTLDILSFLRKENFTDHHLDFLHFVHRRGFRKLSWRLWDFTTRWGKSPFDILEDGHQNLISGPDAVDFISTVSLPPLHHTLIKGYVDKGAALTELNLGDSYNAVKETYHITSQNLLHWIKFLQKTLSILMDALPRVTHSPPSMPPARNITMYIVMQIQILQGLKDIIRHLLRKEAILILLSQAGMFYSSPSW